MNQQGVDLLVQAALKGQRQIRNSLADNHGGLCAIGVLCVTKSLLDDIRTFGIHYGGKELVSMYGLRYRVSCQEPDCGIAGVGELELIAHMNDEHGWDFLTIARKLGVE